MGTKITRKDVLGTCVVVASVIWIVVFGGMYNGQDRKSKKAVIYKCMQLIARFSGRDDFSRESKVIIHAHDLYHLL